MNKTRCAFVLLFLLYCAGSTSFAQTTVSIDNTSSYSSAPAFANGVAYKNFNDAIAKLNVTPLVSSDFPIVFNVTSGQTFNETSIITPITQSGTSSTNTITFQRSGSGTNPLINAANGTGNNDYVISISGGDYIVFDGIDVKNGNSSSTNTKIEWGYYISNNGSNGSQHNSIKNCTVTLDRTDIGSIGIYQKNNTDAGSNTNTPNSYNVYSNITVKNSYKGIVISGFANSSPSVASETKCVVQNCVVGDNASGDIGSPTALSGATDTYGIQAENQSAVSVHNCEIRNVTFYNASGGGYAYGVNFKNVYGTSSLYNNRIHDITNKRNSGSGNAAIGIFVSGATGSTTNVYNNFVARVVNTSTSSSSAVLTMGLSITGAGTVNVYNNAIYFYTTSTVTVSPSALIYVPTGTSATLNIKNNILKDAANTTTNNTYCMYVVSGTVNSSDYNDFDCPATGKYFTGYNGSNRQTLANWQTATGKDGNSKQFAVSFISTSDLHVTASYTDTRYKGAFTINPHIAGDIDGNTIIIPHIGAHTLYRPLDNPLNIDCAELPDVVCNNLIANYGFTHTTDYTDITYGHSPFTSEKVPNWLPFLNEPTIDHFIGGYNNPGQGSADYGLYTDPLPSPATGYASLWYTWDVQPNPVDQTQQFGTGIAQKIPALTSGTQYSLSFYKLQDNSTGNSVGIPPLNDYYKGKLYVMLINCDDYEHNWTVNGGISSPFVLPSNKQIIYCEDKVTNINWEKVSFNFTPNSGYNMICFFTEANNLTVPSGYIYESQVLITLPELLEVPQLPDLKAEIIDAANCTAIIGPDPASTVSPCKFAAATYTWTGPNGQTPVVNANLSTTINASNSQNVGTWTLTMILPSNNSASNECGVPASGFTITKTVNVSLCILPVVPNCITVNKCSGTQLDLNYVYNDNTVTYTWPDNDPMVDAGNYTVYILSSCGSSTASCINVVDYPAPSLQSPITLGKCGGGQYDLSLFYNDPLFAYTWPNGSPLVDAGGPYTVTATNACGISSAAQVTVTTNAATTAPTISPAVSTSVNSGNAFTLMASPSNADSYQWFLNGIHIPGATGVTYTNLSATNAVEGAYTVQVTTSAGCYISAATTVTVN